MADYPLPRVTVRGKGKQSMGLWPSWALCWQFVATASLATRGPCVSRDAMRNALVE